MKLDFDQLQRMAQKFHQDYQEDGDLWEQLDEGAHVYSISFDPREGQARVHLQWPYFRNQVANEAGHFTACDKLGKDILHLTCDSHGVEISTILGRHEIINMLKEHLGDNYEYYEVHEDEDILALFIIWQNLTGWNMEVNK